MAADKVEQRIAWLESTVNKLVGENKKIQHDLERAQAYIEIQNLMSRYEYWHTSDQHNKKGKYVAQKAPGIRMEYINSGVFEGAKSAMKFHVDLHNALGNDKAGKLTFHPLTTPVIEVAGDVKTARGVWISPGIETHTVKGKPIACWCWESYAADFIKEDGLWKWWRIHLHRAFIIPFDKSWVDIDVAKFFNSLNVKPEKFSASLQPDRPTTYFKMFSLNDSFCWTEGIPAAPEPYETYEDWMAVVPPPAK
jgi:hypothetical protein